MALLTAGIPLLVLEYTLGHRSRGSAPLAFRRLHPRAEFLGWWQVGVCLVIASYYAVVVAWAGAFSWFSIGTRWGEDPDAFLFEGYLAMADAGTLGALRPGVVVPLLLVWAVTLGVLLGGVKRGIERAAKVLIPVLVVSFAVLVVRALTLDGAGDGLDALFVPDWGAMADSAVWIAAYGQIFFSLSVGFAIMITYASYLPRRSDLSNNAFIAGFANSSFELLAGIGVFAALGFLAAQEAVAIDEVATEGIGLAFVVFPTIINELPGGNSLFGLLFFGSLVFVGLSSLISIVEAAVSAVCDKFAIGRRQAVLGVGGLLTVASLAFATEGGVPLLDTVDNFANLFGIAVVGLAEVVAVAWVLRQLPSLRAHADAISDIPLGRWWTVALVAITPLLLGLVTIDNLRTTLAAPYEGYPAWFVATFGWGAAAGALLFGLLASIPGWQDVARPAPDPEGRP